MSDFKRYTTQTGYQIDGGLTFVTLGSEVLALSEQDAKCCQDYAYMNGGVVVVEIETEHHMEKIDLIYPN